MALAWSLTLQSRAHQLPFVNASMRALVLKVNCKASSSSSRNSAAPKKKTAVAKKSTGDQKKQVSRNQAPLKKKPASKKQLEEDDDWDDDDDEDDDEFIDESELKKTKVRGFGSKPVAPEEIERQRASKLAARENEKRRKNEVKNTPKNEPKSSSREDATFEKRKEPKPLERIVLDGDEVVEKNKKKTAPVKPPPAPEPAGFKVKIIHLPKKKNIGRDLRKAYHEVQGLLYIKPNESGNKKTRDLICKGSALLTFADKLKADIFIKRFASEKLRFGNIRKSVTYELQGFSKGVPGNRPTGPVLPIRYEDEEGSKTDEKLKNVDKEKVIPGDKPQDEDDVVMDAIIDTIMEESDESEEEEDSEELLEIEKGSGGQRGRASLSTELEYEESEGEFSDDSEEFSDEDESSYEEEDELERSSGIVVHDDLKVDKNGGVDIDVDVSAPFNIRDLGGEDPSEIIRNNTKKMEELDEKIKHLVEKKSKSPELKKEILSLKEEKVELLEKRVIARMVLAREAAKTKRLQKQQLNI